MFIELHDTSGHATLVCVDDIQRVCKGTHGGSDIFMNEHDEPVRVAESVAAIKELILKTGAMVAASAKVEVAAAPVRLQPIDGSRDKE